MEAGFAPAIAARAKGYSPRTPGDLDGGRPHNGGVASTYLCRMGADNEGPRRHLESRASARAAPSTPRGRNISAMARRGIYCMENWSGRRANRDSVRPVLEFLET